MNLPFYQVDAFTTHPFSGNPAAVVYHEAPMQSITMQKIATENNLSETAFLHLSVDGVYDLRWFTPTAEVDLCGHATLASAHILFSEYGIGSSVRFSTKSGVLAASKVSEGIQLDFPSRPPQKLDVEIPPLTSIAPSECWGSRDLVLVYESEDDILSLTPDYSAMKEQDYLGVIVTAQGSDCDFVSRFFAPGVGVPEDPVTGSAHATLTPFWSDRLNKKELLAIQLSERRGYIKCVLDDKRVLLTGNAVTVIKGNFIL